MTSSTEMVNAWLDAVDQTLEGTFDFTYVYLGLAFLIIGMLLLIQPVRRMLLDLLK